MENANVFYSTDNKDYDNMKDEDLIEIIKSGDKQAFEYLINKYKELVNLKVGKYFIIGAEKDDIMQEGLIGLFKAIKSYKSDMQSSFKSFANMCIERQLITAIKTDCPIEIVLISIHSNSQVRTYPALSHPPVAEAEHESQTFSYHKFPSAW